MKRAAIALSLAAAIVIAGCGGNDETEGLTDQTGGTAASLVGKYVSGSNPQGPGIPFSSPVVVKIDHSQIFWEARCNSYGARLEITDEQLMIEGTESTAVGCEGSAKQQDKDLVEFFESNPYWNLDGDQLTLKTSTSVAPEDLVEVGLDRDAHPAAYLEGAHPSTTASRHPNDVPPSERCGADKLNNCDATSACTIKFEINPDDPDGWNQPHGWTACLKHFGASQEIIRQYQPS